MTGYVWYEVFSSDEDGNTITLEAFDSLSEARAWKKKRLEEQPDVELHIDKWEENEDGDVKIKGEVE